MLSTDHTSLALSIRNVDNFYLNHAIFLRNIPYSVLSCHEMFLFFTQSANDSRTYRQHTKRHHNFFCLSPKKSLTTSSRFTKRNCSYASPSSSRPRTTAFHAVDRGSNPLGDANIRYNKGYQCVKHIGILSFFVSTGFPVVHVCPVASNACRGISEGRSMI